jgi:hypothetical protein
MKNTTFATLVIAWLFKSVKIFYFGYCCCPLIITELKEKLKKLEAKRQELERCRLLLKKKPNNNDKQNLCISNEITETSDPNNDESQIKLKVEPKVEPQVELNNVETTFLKKKECIPAQ